MLILAPMVGALALSPALAQENGDEPFTTSAGPYQIEVWAVPSNLSLGQVIFAVKVLDSATKEPVPDPRVTIRVRHELEDTEGWGLAVRTNDIPGRYDAQMNLEAPGVWRVNVEVSSSLGQVSVEIPPVTVPAERGPSQGSIVFLALFWVLVLGALYVWWSARREQRKRAAHLSSEGLGQDEEGRD